MKYASPQKIGVVSQLLYRKEKCKCCIWLVYTIEIILNYMGNPLCPFKVGINEDETVYNLITMKPVSNWLYFKKLTLI